MDFLRWKIFVLNKCIAQFLHVVLIINTYKPILIKVHKFLHFVNKHFRKFISLFSLSVKRYFCLTCNCNLIMMNLLRPQVIMALLLFKLWFINNFTQVCSLLNVFNMLDIQRTVHCDIFL
jgi:hypothetical protein